MGTHRFIMKTILAILFFCVVATLAEPINEKRGFKRCRSHGDCGNANQCCIGGFYCGHYAQEGHLALSLLLSPADVPQDWTVSRPDSSPNDVSITEAAVDS